MTVASTTRKAGPFSGNGSTTSFPFLFKVFTKNDIQVVRADASGVETVLTLDSDYSVTLNADQTASPGGTITYPISGSPLASGLTLAILGSLAYSQGTSLPTGGAFNAANVEAALDRLTILNQQLLEKVNRAALVPVTNAADATILVQDILLLANNIAVLQAIVANAANINTVAGNTTNINTVAGNNTNVTNVGGSIANVNTVAAAIASVITNAANIGSINTNATNISSIVNALANANAAASSANAASAAAAAAAASAAAGMYSSVQDKSANYSILVTDAGDLIRMGTGSGALTVSLPDISSVPDGFNISVVKWTGDSNTVTVQRAGTNLINGSTTYVLDAQYKSATFVADAESGTWFAAGSGGGGTNTIVDAGTGTGASTLSLSGDPGSKNNTHLVIGGVYQLKSSYSLSGTTITTSSAVPNGVSWECAWTQPLSIGVPGDATVSTSKLADNAVTNQKMGAGAARANLGLTTWNVTESGGVLYFSVGGTNKGKLDGSGNLTVTGNVTAYGTV